MWRVEEFLHGVPRVFVFFSSFCFLCTKPHCARLTSSNNAPGHNIHNAPWRTLCSRPECKHKTQSGAHDTHQHRLAYTMDHKTGEYFCLFPNPTGIPADVVLTLHGVNQSRELGAHLASRQFVPKPFRIYSSPFYRCLQTIQPTVEMLKERHQEQRLRGVDNGIDDGAVFDVRTENGLGYAFSREKERRTPLGLFFFFFFSLVFVFAD